MSTRDREAGGHSRAGLMALQPVDTAPFRRPSNPIFIWFTILLFWMLSLLPWRLWYPAPDLLLLVLVFWSLHEPRRVGFITAFVLGLLLDVHDGGLLGGHALCYTVAVYGAFALHRRLQRFGPWIQTLHMLPVFVVACAIARLAYAWINGEWEGWDWLWSALFTGALWPVADVLLFLPQRRFDDTDTSVI